MADPAKSRDRVCSAAYDAARQLETAGHLRQATEQLLKCANSACSGWVRHQCSNRYFQLEEDIPTVVPLATDELGAARVDVQVSVDGESLTSRLDGRALPVDPGLHEFSFTADGVVTKTKILIVQGARNRPVSVSLPEAQAPKNAGARVASEGTAAAKVAPVIEPKQSKLPEASSGDGPTPDPAKPALVTPSLSASGASSSASDTTETSPAAKTKSGPGAAPYLIGAAGLAGVGAFGLLTYWGRMDNQQLRQCAPYCSAQSVDHIKSMYLAANVSLGVGVAALGVATTWLLLSSGAAKKERTSPPVALGVAPTPSGGLATVSGSF
jgi:hypothetical protein